ncbi:MAG: hypothetical protein LBQ71_02185 [Hungatella sp.]|jgi:hypothetical protein|nr:hypothetical protein [Hungatella sp.]
MGKVYAELYTAFQIVMYTNEQLMNLISFLLEERKKADESQGLSFEELMKGI